tara:strand:+ start:1862 stop:2572 length:711 start_codon:yes stop_codon:yes gene_type:complete
MSHPLSQLSFDFMAPNDCTLESYFWGANTQVRSCFETMLAGGHSSQRFVFLYGPAGSGITHLLKGFSHALQQGHCQVLYLSFRALSQYPSYFGQWDAVEWLILDDVEFIENSSEWQERVLALYESLLPTKTRLLIGSHCSPRQLDIALPDLKSRLMNFWEYRLELMSDEDKVLCLEYITRQQGLMVDRPVLEYMLAHMARNVGQMLVMLKSAESVASINKTKITIPIIKSIASGLR